MIKQASFLIFMLIGRMYSTLLYNLNYKVHVFFRRKSSNTWNIEVASFTTPEQTTQIQEELKATLSLVSGNSKSSKDRGRAQKKPVNNESSYWYLLEVNIYFYENRSQDSEDFALNTMIILCINAT
ncbi:hypothetical protein BY458DRAFT_487744 [Sporodiniella umbellata]|nr:hypothetical protein BY458DRAFT_487744 [Sporodiniella umbellata]